MRATHKGHCQCCGSQQKLPSGVLSNHGYRVLWGGFQGVCEGAGHESYERSCALIRSFIAKAEAERTRLQKWQVELRKPATEEKAWYHEYRSSWSRKSENGYFWREVQLRLKPDVDGRLAQYLNYEDRWARIDHYRHWITLIDLATLLNCERAESLNTDIKRLTDYIGWQTERVEAWKLQPLLPLKAGE